MGLLLDKSFFHITLIEHCHSSGPKRRVHLLPAFGANRPCQAAGTLHNAAVVDNHMYCTTESYMIHMLVNAVMIMKYITL